jgi:5-methylcytosine-specific restriction endonuclease McrA
MKKITTKNTKTQVVAAIRKIWRTHPIRTKAISLACLDEKEKVHNRKYKCSVCKKHFLKQQVEVNHKTAAPKNESLQDFVSRIFCNIKSYKGEEVILSTGEKTTIKELAEKNLEVVCKECHKKITKEQNKKRKT